MYKLGLEKAEKPEIKLPTFTGLWRKQGNSRKTSTTASLTKLKPLTVWITTNCGIFLSYLNIHLTCLLRNLYADQEPTVRTSPEITNWFQFGKKVRQGCILSPCLFNICNPMDCSTPRFPVCHHLPEFTQIHVHRVTGAIQPSHSLSSPSPPALNLFQHQGLFQ